MAKAINAHSGLTIELNDKHLDLLRKHNNIRNGGVWIMPEDFGGYNVEPSEMDVTQEVVEEKQVKRRSTKSELVEQLVSMGVDRDSLKGRTVAELKKAIEKINN